MTDYRDPNYRDPIIADTEPMPADPQPLVDGDLGLDRRHFGGGADPDFRVRHGR